MLKNTPMKKVFIVGPRASMRNVIEKLYELGTLHIVDYSRENQEEFLSIGKPYPEGETLSETLVKIRTLLTYLNVKNAKADKKEYTLKEIEERTSRQFDETSMLQKEIKYYDRILEAYDKNRINDALQTLQIRFEDGVDYSGMSYFIGFTYTPVTAEEAEKVTKQYRLFTSVFEDLNMVALLVSSKKAEEAERMLESHSFVSVEKPFVAALYPDMQAEPAVEYTKLGQAAEDIKDRKKGLYDKLTDIKEKNQSFLVAAEGMLSAKIELAEAPLRFATSENTFIIRGWVPSKKVKTMEKELVKLTSNKVYISIEDPEESDAVPTRMENPKFVKPFEFFINLYALPKYNEIDPTFFMFITFPLFFGFMLGDIGYGLVTFALFWYLRSRMSSGKDLLNALLISSGASIAFGFVFGEIFGLEKIGHFELPRLMSRTESPNQLLIIALIIGVVHVNFGLIIGFINELNHHGLKKAILAKLCWVVIEIGAALIYLSMQKALPFSWFVGLGVILVGCVMLAMGEGPIALIELPSLLSNILSYARLMAVGLASVSLALVINNMAGGLFKSGIVGIIGGILILLIGHIINFALGILSPFLHSLRLHYVELFTKFYQGGGFRFKPFGNKTNH